MALNKLLLFCVLLVSANSYGGIFKCADGHGRVVYSDTECATRADRELVKIVHGPIQVQPHADSPSGSPVSALIEKLQAKIRGLSNGSALTSALPSSLDTSSLDSSQLTQMLQALQVLALPGGNGSSGLEASQFTQVLQALQALQCGGNADCLQTASCNEVGQLMGLCPNAGMDGKQ